MMAETKQGVAQRVIAENERAFPSKHNQDDYSVGKVHGLHTMHDELSAEAREVLAEMDADIQQILSGDDELERDYQDIDSIELEQSLIRRFSKRLGLDLEGGDS